MLSDVHYHICMLYITLIYLLKVPIAVLHTQLHPKVRNKVGYHALCSHNQFILKY
jgi:hypothetical protein